MPTIKSVLKILGSLWFATALLLILMVAMGSATIYETQHGLDETRAMFYLAPWFKTLLALFALNVFAALLVKFPWTAKQTPFVMAHTGLIVILAGALVTDMKGINGQLALKPNQSSDRFLSDIDAVSIHPKNSNDGPTAIIEEHISRAVDKVNLEGVQAFSLDDINVRVLQYYPDFIMEKTMTNENPKPNPLLEVRLGNSEHSHAAWIPAGGSKVIGPAFATFRVVASDDEWKALQAETPADTSSGGSQLIIAVDGNETTLTLSSCLKKDTAIAETGYTINALRYLPHAVVGEDKAVYNASDEPVNPAVEYVIGKDGKQVRRLAFAKFPDFVSLLEGEGMDNVKVVFKEAREIAKKRAPIEIYAGPNNAFGVRFSSQTGNSPLQIVAFNQAMLTPFSKEALTLLQFLPNAQEKLVPKLASPLRKNRQPAVEVEISTPDSTQKQWLAKNRALTTVGKKGEYQVVYEDLPNKFGFKVKLDSFKVSYYPGGMRPRTYESQVTFEDPETGTTQSQLIAMNKPGKFGGYTFYQSSYFGEEGNQGSVLSVAKDPGLPIVYLGYFLTVCGMLIQLLNRSKQGEQLWARIKGLMGKKSAALLVFFVCAGAAVAGPSNIDQKSLDTLRTIPVQYKGRYMPLDTFSRDIVRTITGSEDFRGYDPVALVLTWIFEAAKWEKESVFSISNDEFRSLLKLPEKQTTFSFQELVSHQPLRELATQAAQKQERREKLDALEMKVQDLENQLVTYRNVLFAEEISIIPNPNDGLAKWQTINWLTKTQNHDYHELKKAWFGLGGAYKDKDANAMRQASQSLVMQLDALPAKFRPSKANITQEIHYNQLAPWTKAWILMLLGTVLALASVFIKKKGVDVATTLSMVLGFGMLTYGIYLRWMIAGRIPASNMFESLLFLSWGAAAFTILGPFLFKNRIVTLTGAFIAGLSLMLADVLPIDASIKPVAPVLLDTFWMALHVPVIMISYSVLAIAMLVAHVQVIGMGLFGKRWKYEEATDTFLYWYMFSGSLLLIVGILTGSLWAAASWGRYWGWDPKEVWSLVAFLGYMAIMHLRVLKKKETPIALQVVCILLAVFTFVQVFILMAPMTTGKILSYVAVAVVMVYFLYAKSRFAVAAKNILSFWLIIMTYVGVNYILGTGLHSYGFGTGAAAWGMIWTGSIDLGILMVCLLAYYLRCYLRPDAVAAEDTLPAEA